MTIRTLVLSGLALAGMAFISCSGNEHLPSQPTQPTAQTQPPPAAGPTLPVPPPQPDPAHPLAGAYSLTLTIGPSCTGLPAQERKREYDASIDFKPNGQYVVTLGGSAFLSGPICTEASGGYACNQFLALDDTDRALFSLVNDNDGHGGHIVEQTRSGTWIEIIGNAGGVLNTDSIAASGTGTVWYCGTSSAYPFPCSQIGFCQSTDMALTFTRK